MATNVSFSIPARRLPERLSPTPHPKTNDIPSFNKHPPENKRRSNRKSGRWPRSAIHGCVLLAVTLLWWAVVSLYVRNNDAPNVRPYRRTLQGMRASNPLVFPFLRPLGDYSEVQPLLALSNEDTTGRRSFRRDGDDNFACTLVESSSNPTAANYSQGGYRFDMVPSELEHWKHVPQTTATNGCVVSHQYKFVYIHVLKSGGMTLKSFLKKALCGGDTSMPCRRGTDVLQVVSCDQVFRHPVQHQDYLVWSVVRNPFARMYSGYAMARAFATTQHGESSSWEFRDFVMHRERRSAYSSTDVVHYQPQHEFLFSSGGCPVVDYVLRMETIHRDLKVLLRILNCPELSQFYSDHGLERATDTDFGRRHMFEQMQTLDGAYTGLLQDEVAREYAKDFALFGYDTFQVPS